jgi:hypothetical protein
VGFEVLVEVAHVCECFSAVFNRAYVGSDFEVHDFVMCLERVCLLISTITRRNWLQVDIQL